MKIPTRVCSLKSISHLCLAALAAGSLAACVDAPDDVAGPDNAVAESASDEDPPTDEEQREEMEIRARLVRDLDPARWDGWREDGIARFATVSADPPEPDETRVTGAQGRGDGVLVLADGRRFRLSHQQAERLVGEAGPSERDLERSVIGADGRTLVASGNYTQYPWRAVGAILSKSNSKTGWCTASLIGPRLALTAGHCVFDQDTQAWSWNTWFSPGHRGDGATRFPNGTPRQVVGLLSFDGWVDDADWNHDVGFLILADAANTASLGWFGFTNAWDLSDHEGITATTLQYPGAGFMCAASPDASGLCKGFQYRGTGTVVDTCGNKIAHDVDSNPGSSGSPFYRWRNGGRFVIGPHTNGVGGNACGAQRNAATWLNDGKVGTACSLLKSFPSAFAPAFCQ